MPAAPVHHIRPCRPGEGAILAHIFSRAVHQLAAVDYDEAQRKAWAPASVDPVAFEHRAMDGRLTLVAIDSEDRPIAYGDLEGDGHIDHLFCDPDHAGRGLGRSLLNALEAEGLARSVSRLYVEASETARTLFRRCGFRELRRRDFELNGVPIHHYIMEKTLSA